jgi:hypothetical protein
MGGWRVAQRPILSSTITIDSLKNSGCISLVDYYRKQYRERTAPEMSGRTLRTLVLRQMLSRAVRGAPWLLAHGRLLDYMLLFYD